METLSQIASSIDEYLPETEHTLFTHRNNQFIESFERKRASNEIIETKEHGRKDYYLSAGARNWIRDRKEDTVFVGDWKRLKNALWN